MKRYTNAHKSHVVLFFLAASLCHNKDVEFRQGLPHVEELESCLLVLDDMMDHMESGVADLLTKGSHHKYICHYIDPECASPKQILEDYQIEHTTWSCLRIPEMPARFNTWPDRCTPQIQNTLCRCMKE